MKAKPFLFFSKTFFLGLFLISFFNSTAQTSRFTKDEYKAAYEYLLIHYPDLIEYCHHFGNLNNCDKFVSANKQDSILFYSGTIWKYANHRRFRPGGRDGHSADYFDYASGRLILLTFTEKPEKKWQAGQNIQLAEEKIFTIEGKIESTVSIHLKIPEANKKNKKRLKELRLIISWLE